MPEMKRICDHCDALNPDDVPCCTQCGAPLGRSKLFGISAEAAPLSLRSSILGAPYFPVQGIDLSKWNGVWDFGVTEKKCQYAFIRIGYGDGYKDSRCDQYRQDLLTHDIPYGVYYFAYAGYSWQEHAENFTRIAAEYPYQLDMVIDAEWTNLGTMSTLAWYVNFRDRLEDLTGKTPAIYTSAGFWDARVARSEQFLANKLWVANWTLADHPLLPKDWQYADWVHWQHSADNNGRAREYGMIADGDPDIDLDRYFGSVDQFNAEYGTHILPIGDEPPPPPLLKMVRTTAGQLNVRLTPMGTKIGYVPQGTLFGVNGQSIYNGVKWHKIGAAFVSSEYCEEIE